MGDLVGRLRDENLPMSRDEVAQEVEQLERELAEARDMLIGISKERDSAISARDEALRVFWAEKALADRFNDAVYGREIMAEVVASYRKARGL